MAFHTPHGSARFRLPWSWSSFDYRELCRALWEQSDARFEIAKVEGRDGRHRRTPTAATHRAADRRRPRLAPRARPGANVQPPEAPISRGLEVHPRRRRDRPRRLDRPQPRPLRLRLVGAGGRRAARRRRLLRAAPPRQGADQGDRRGGSTSTPVRYQGNWFPHRLRPAAEDGVFFAGDSAGHCLPLSGEGIRTAFYFGIAAAREIRAVLAGEQHDAGRARRATAPSRAATRRRSPPRSRSSARSRALPPRALTALLARRWAASGPCRPRVRLVPRDRTRRRSGPALRGRWRPPRADPPSGELRALGL